MPDDVQSLTSETVSNQIFKQLPECRLCKSSGGFPVRQVTIIAIDIAKRSWLNNNQFYIRGNEPPISGEYRCNTEQLKIPPIAPIVPVSPVSPIIPIIPIVPVVPLSNLLIQSSPITQMRYVCNRVVLSLLQSDPHCDNAVHEEIVSWRDASPTEMRTYHERQTIPHQIPESSQILDRSSHLCLPPVMAYCTHMAKSCKELN